MNKIRDKVIQKCYDVSKELINNIDNIELLYASMKLYEQKKEYESNKQKNIEHVEYWNNVDTYKDLEILKEKVEEIGFEGYPWDLNIECSTLCNAHCKNCTHETLIKTGKRKLKNAELEDIFYVIRKLKLITLLNKVPEEKIIFTPVGLGEPLMYPHIFQVYKYARIFFPKSNMKINTNALLLNEENAEKLLEAGVNEIILSLSYIDKETYEEEIGIDYNKVVQNIKKFFEMQKNVDTYTDLHIFDNPLNGAKQKIRFQLEMGRYRSRLEDRLVYRVFSKKTEESKTSSWDNNIQEKTKFSNSPCYAIWQTWMIDVEGNIYPCCQGVWDAYSKEICVGNISDDIPDILNRIKDLRSEQINEIFSEKCRNCETRNRPEYINAMQELLKESKEVGIDVVRKSVKNRYKRQQILKVDFNSMNRLEKLGNLLMLWMYNKNSKKEISSYLFENGYKKVMIYGMGGIGELLYDELQQNKNRLEKENKESNKVEVEGFIDQNAEILRNRPLAKVYSIQEFLKIQKEIDAIIITPFYVKKQIYRNLEEYGITNKLLSIDDIVLELDK